jgi:hypothetical protein
MWRQLTQVSISNIKRGIQFLLIEYQFLPIPPINIQHIFKEFWFKGATNYSARGANMSGSGPVRTIHREMTERRVLEVNEFNNLSCYQVQNGTSDTFLRHLVSFI